MRTTFVLSSVLLLAGAVSPVHAQDSSWNVGVSAVAVQYDLSGTGTAPGLAVRAARPVYGNVMVEVRGLFARPEQQSGPSTFFAPEAQLQYRWNVARFSPYVGGGAGLAATASPLRTDWDPTLSVAVGTGVRLNDRLDLTGELRLRGIEWRFVGSTAEWSAGLRWRLPSF
jgi:hypothetical protein